MIKIDKPFAIIDHPYLTEEEKQKFSEILVEWACFYEGVDWGEFHVSSIKEQLGVSENELDELMRIHKSQDIYESIKKAWLYGKRPLTVKEICSIFRFKFSETNIRKQVNKLSKHGYIKEIKVKVKGTPIAFYYVPDESIEKYIYKL